MQKPVKYFYQRLNSTNLYANQLLKEFPHRDPFWIRTNDQFAGRGQGNHKWESEAGKNLIGTLVLFPEKLLASRQFCLSKAFALSAVSFLDLFLDDIFIKWPNDLYAGSRKIGGLLIETAIIGNLLDHVVLGVGININQTQFSPNLPNPVSMLMLSGIEYDLTQMEDLFLDSVEHTWSLVDQGRFDELNERYLDRLFGFGTMQNFKSVQGKFTAKIAGVGEFGHLLLQSPNGELKTYAFQEVEYLPPLSKE